MRAGPSHIGHLNVPSSSEPGPRISGRPVGRPVVRHVPTPHVQASDLLVPLLHYTGNIDVNVFPTIGQDLNSPSFDSCSGTFQV